jgi:hypothetical protein
MNGSAMRDQHEHISPGAEPRFMTPRSPYQWHPDLERDHAAPNKTIGLGIEGWLPDIAEASCDQPLQTEGRRSQSLPNKAMYLPGYRLPSLPQRDSTGPAPDRNGVEPRIALMRDEAKHPFPWAILGPSSESPCPPHDPDIYASVVFGRREHHGSQSSAVNIPDIE